MTSTTLTIDQLCLSPFNVRKLTPTPENTIPIEASILVEGLRVPIDCHQMRGSNTKWGAFAGRRRYFAIKRLVERVDLPGDWPIPVVVHTGSDAELIEKSITENLIRQDMEDYELWVGVAMAAAKGHTVDQITHNLGQRDTKKVARWLRLGQLPKPILEAIAAGTFDAGEEVAQAFAATQDADLQMQVFERFRGNRYAAASHIRAAMGIGDALSRRQLMFVGEAIYRAAGGRYELDLFADATDDRGRITDKGLLQRLVEEKMAVIRDQVRASIDRPDLRFVTEPPKIGQHQVDHSLRVTPTAKGGKLVLPGADVVAQIEIDGGGEATVSYWWESRKAKHGTVKGKAGKEVAYTPREAIGNAIADPYLAKPRADAAIRREEGISQDATFALRAVRKAILRAALVDDAEAGGTEGRDYLVFAQFRMLLAVQRPANVGIRPIAEVHDVGVSFDAQELARAIVGGTPASRRTAEALSILHQEPWFTEPDLTRAYEIYRGADETMKALTAALVAGVALERSLAAPGYEIPLHDTVAHHAGADRDDEVRRHWWQPTADVLDFFPKDQRMELGHPFVDGATYAAWGKLKSQDLTSAVLAALTRAGGRGEHWVHPLLSFDTPRTGAELKEAAE
ncbi:ParB/RepB/Spo0J family partition protein [Sphingomonas adhaesiva]|uniref:ParB/RepB/Spo0J family partition protein n=1 Tax=Sphingomonas adhaesiva TaxID=28212 RepID=UPI002FF6424E